MPLLRTRSVHNLPAAVGPAKRSGLARALCGTAIAVLAVAALLLVGLVRFAVPPPPEHEAASTDAIVVLTGGSLRLQSGIDLLREGKGRTLFVSGVDQQVSANELLRQAGEAARHWLVCCIVLGHQADNTVGNALETAQWMRRQGYHSLRLVTSWYHMPRSLLEFKRAMPEFEIIPHPVFSEQVRQQNWWAWRGTAALLIGEYGKYLAAMFLPFVDRPPVGGSLRIAAEARR